MANSETITGRSVYVWEWPVRVYHTINGLCVLALIVSGFLIGRAIAFGNAPEAYQQYWFGTLRFVHFVAAYLFFFNFLVRIYWGFVGNEYASWRNFIPHKKAQFLEILEVLKMDILRAKERKATSVGHNALASFTYLLTFFVFLFQSVTGFALYASMSSSFLPKMFNWIVPLMGGDAAVRQWHHLSMWFFVVFTITHVYIVFYHDFVEGGGIVKSIMNGRKNDRNNVAE